jgi:protein transport protein SEC24
MAVLARNVSSDVRNYWIHKMLAMNVRSIMHHLYPRMLALHDLDDEIALPKEGTGGVELPSLMRNSHLFMEGNGVYLIGKLTQHLVGPITALIRRI